MILIEKAKVDVNIRVRRSSSSETLAAGCSRLVGQNRFAASLCRSRHTSPTAGAAKPGPQTRPRITMTFMFSVPPNSYVASLNFKLLCTEWYVSVAPSSLSLSPAQGKPSTTVGRPIAPGQTTNLRESKGANTWPFNHVPRTRRHIPPSAASTAQQHDWAQLWWSPRFSKTGTKTHTEKNE